MSMHKNLHVDELYKRITYAIFAGKNAAISVTYKVAEYEDDGIYTPATTTEHVGKVVAATLQDASTQKRLMVFIAGMPKPLEISSDTETAIKIDN